MEINFMSKKMTYDNFFDRLLELIRDRRKELGLTQADLAAKMKKPQSVIGRLESGGVRDPRVSMLFQVCQAMDLDPSEVLVRAGVTGTGAIDAKNLAGARRKAERLKKGVQANIELIDDMIKLM